MIFKAFGIAAICVFAASAAQAGDFTAVKHGSYMIDLDTQDGNFSLWKTEEVADLNALKAHVTFARKGGGKYAPMVSLSLYSGDKRVNLQFTAFPKSGPLIGYVTGNQGSNDPNRQLIMTPPNFEEGFDIRARWTPEGKVSFDVYSKANETLGQGFEHHEIDLGGPVTSIQISNSTSEVEFNKLELGTEAP